MARIFFTLFLFLLSSCATIPYVCRPEGARQTGIAMAMRGDQLSYVQGVACSEEHQPIFRNAIQAGYEEGKRSYCSPKYTKSLGVQDGEAGQSSQFQASKYGICGGTGNLKAAYDGGYREGLSRYCSQTNMREAGQNDGRAGRKGAFDASPYLVCGKTVVSRMRNAFNTGVREGLNAFCQGADASSDGFNDGRQGKERIDMAAKYVNCSTDRRRKAQTLYDSNYDQGYRQFCSDSRIRSASQTNARQSSSVKVPLEIVKCFQAFPQLEDDYLTFFHQERDRVVVAECSYQRGYSKGRYDAARQNTKRTEMPSFCDRSLFSVYLNGYLEGWREEKARRCSPEKAYDQGVFDARRYRSRRYRLPTPCPRHVHRELRRKYNEGYNWARRRRDRPVVVTPPRPVSRPVRACLRKGFSRRQCRGVTSVVCINEGFRPKHCKLPTTYLDAVEACLRRDYHPRECRYVKRRRCIERGRPPHRCQ